MAVQCSFPISPARPELGLKQFRQIRFQKFILWSTCSQSISDLGLQRWPNFFKTQLCWISGMVELSDSRNISVYIYELSVIRLNRNLTNMSFVVLKVEHIRFGKSWKPKRRALGIDRDPFNQCFFSFHKQSECRTTCTNMSVFSNQIICCSWSSPVAITATNLIGYVVIGSPERHGAMCRWSGPRYPPT